MINPQKAQKIRRLLICLIPTAVLTASGSTVSVSIIKTIQHNLSSLLTALRQAFGIIT